MTDPEDRKREAYRVVRALVGISGAHATIANQDIGPVHVILFDNRDQDASDLHFGIDCPGESCPRYYPR